jgi:hypothetical protein
MSNDVHKMDEDYPVIVSQATTAAEEAVQAARRHAATVRDNTPSSAAVKEGWDEWAAQGAAWAAQAEQLHSLSRSVDQDGYRAGERYGNDPNGGAWTGR